MSRNGSRSEFDAPDYTPEAQDKKYFKPRTTHALHETKMATVEVEDGKIVLTGFYGRVRATPELVEEHIGHLQDAIEYVRGQE